MIYKRFELKFEISTTILQSFTQYFYVFIAFSSNQLYGFVLHNGSSSICLLVLGE